MTHVIRKFLYKNFILLYKVSRAASYRFTESGFLTLSVLTAAAVFGLDTRQTHAYMLFSILFVLFLISLVIVNFKRLKIETYRSLPEYCTNGTPLKYDIIISNKKNHVIRNLIIMDELTNTLPSFKEFSHYKDDSDRNLNVFDRMIGFPRMISLINKKRGADIRPEIIEKLGNNETIKKSFTISPSRRGYLYFNQTVYAGCDPLGLMRKPKRFKNNQPLLVLPRQYRMPEISLHGNRKYQQGGINLASSIGESGDFHSLRDYRSGDPKRKIHWRTYARKNKPVVKEFHDEYFSRTGLVLDTFIDKDNSLVFEDAVSVATSIVLSHKHQDSLLDLMFINDKAYRTTSGRALGDERGLIELLACVDTMPLNQFQKLAGLTQQYARETSAFIFILLDWDEQRKELVRQLKLRNIPILVIVITDQSNSLNNDYDCMGDCKKNFWLLEAGDIQNSLDAIT